jgi:signal transduction histidine kinase
MAPTPVLGYVAVMRRLGVVTPRRLDVALTGVIACLGLVDVWTYPHPEGPRALMSLGFLAMALPLLARRRAPILVLAAVLTASAVSDLLWNMLDDLASPMAPMLVAVYSAGAYSVQRKALAGLGVMLGFIAVGSTVDYVPVSDVLFVSIIFGGVWATGRLVHARQQTADAMADRAALAEREREERARAAVAEERARIARELHDVVAHSISVMVVQAGAERRALGEERADTREVLHTIEQTGRQTLTEMRRLLGMLRRSDDEIELAPQPGMEHVDALVDQVREAGLPVTLSIEGDRSPLPAGVDLSAYRIVQEALTNALKHAGPASARVTVRYGDGELELDIVDDGAGAMNGDGGGHGLIGMRERVTMFGGALDAGARREGGYAVRARLPIAG